MSWTSPQTWVAGSVVTAATLNTHLRDNLLELNGTASAWAAYTPTLSAIAATITEARWKQVAKTITASVVLTLTGAPSGAFAVGIPAAARALVGGAGVRAIGIASALRVGVVLRVAAVSLTSTTAVNFVDPNGGGAWSATVPFTWVTGDSLGLTTVYEAA